jgi:hypothetical protein
MFAEYGGPAGGARQLASTKGPAAVAESVASMSDARGHLVRRTILAVLGTWHGLAATQNTFDLLASTGVAPRLRPLASKNMELVAKLTEPLHPSKSTLVLLVSGAAAIEAAASLSFVRGAVDGKRSELGFCLSLTLFGTFFLIDDAFDEYDLGAKHRAIFSLLAVSYLAVRAAKR